MGEVYNFKYEIMHVLAHNPSVVPSQNITRLMIVRHLFLSFHRHGMFAVPSCYTASYLLVPLPFEPHCASITVEANHAVFVTFFNGWRFFLSESKSYRFFGGG